MANSILINGNVHDWNDTDVKIMGISVKGITSINWKVAKEKELQYAAGAAPHGVGYGHKSYTCDFELTMATARTFEAAMNLIGKDATDYAPFLIVIQYADKVVGSDGALGQEWGIATTKLMDVDVTDFEQGIDEGTKKITRKYTAVVGKILAT